MKKSVWKRWLVGALILVGIGFSQVGGWRIEATKAYFRGVVNPVEGIPTPIKPLATGEIFLTTSPASATETPFVASEISIDITPTLEILPTSLPSSILLESPKWEQQDWNNCGPATIGMYFRYYGWEGDQFDISSDVKPEREDRNVNIEELLFYAHTQVGWLQTINRVGGNIQLLKSFLAEGIPVMVEAGYFLDENYWPEDDRWAGHYLLLTGFDDAKQSFIVQDSFKGSDLEITYQDLEEGWQAFNHVYILSYLPSQAVTVAHILGEEMDEEINRQRTLERSLSAVEESPNNTFEWFNLGSNLIYYEEYNQAVEAYNRSRELGLPQRMLRYQFGPFFAYFHGFEMEELEAILDYALQITPNSEEALVWQGWYYYRLDEVGKAINSFREAYWYNTESADALYGLNFLNASP